MKPACDSCRKAEVDSLQKARGPGCERCARRKVKCSLVGERKKERKTEPGVLTGPNSDGVLAPLVELSDGFMEQIEAMGRKMGETNDGIWVLVRGVGRLTEVVGRLVESREREKNGERKMESGVQTEPEVWRVPNLYPEDKIVDMEDGNRKTETQRTEKDGDDGEDEKDGEKDGDGEEMEIGE
jgi:hypothetical protein